MSKLKKHEGLRLEIDTPKHYSWDNTPVIRLVTATEIYHISCFAVPLDNFTEKVYQIHAKTIRFFAKTIRFFGWCHYFPSILNSLRLDL